MTCHCYKLLMHINRYLNEPHVTDKTSFSVSTDLQGDAPKWSDESNTMCVAPMSPFEPNSTGKYKVLTTSLLGDWHGQAKKLDYPVQIVQALKDVACNLIWQKTEKIPQLQDSSTVNLVIQGLSVVLVDGMFSEDNRTRDNFSKLIGHPLSNPYETLRINPTAWASRLVRLNMIAASQKSLIMCQQRLTLWPVLSTTQIESFNQKFGLTDADSRWDGILWPYGKHDFLLSST